MCGICGFLHVQGKPVDTAVARQMMELIRHRGPDGSGSLVLGGDSASAPPSVFLGQRRLKIIDLSEAAKNPLPNEDESVWITFNGEIYNFPSLRAELEARGHVFRSRSDTETIVHGYEDFGDDFVQRLDGMFAFALWDARRRRLLIARDRSGKKPLFYSFDGSSFTFGSEIKALLACPWVKHDVPVERIADYLLFGYVRAPDTFYHGIFQLPPGCYLTVEDGAVKGPVRYWDLKPSVVGPKRSLSRAAAASEVRELFTKAVERRLISDVPLGALLSGGIDSTIVVGVMSKLMDQPVRTFTVGFTDSPSYDERAYAGVAARAFKTDHMEFAVETDAVSLVRRLLWHHDQPYGDSSAIPTYLVSKLAREHVTVVLNGDGGDEVFGGYERFMAALWAERIPGFIGSLGETLAHLLPRSDSYYGLRRRLERFVARSDEPVLNRYLAWVGIFDVPTTMSLLRPEVAARSNPATVYSTIGEHYVPNGDASLLDRLLYLNFTTYLPFDLHVKADRMSMANALEMRSPMLDTALVEFMASLPDDFKIRGGTLKYLLKLAFADLVPPELLKRRKHGFGVPVDRWFRGELKEFTAELLLRPESRIREYLVQDQVRRLFEEHVRGIAQHGHRLWTLVNLELWFRMLEEGAMSRPFPADMEEAAPEVRVAAGPS